MNLPWPISPANKKLIEIQDPALKSYKFLQSTWLIHHYIGFKIFNSYYVNKFFAKYFLFLFNVQKITYTYLRVFSI